MAIYVNLPSATGISPHIDDHVKWFGMQVVFPPREPGGQMPTQILYSIAFPDVGFHIKLPISC